MAEGLDLFGRKYKLSIGRPTTVKVDSNETDMSPNAVALRRDKAEYVASYATSPQVRPVDIEEYRINITDLQIKATIYEERTVTAKKSQPTTIEIYNLSKETLGRLSVGQLIYLSGGYVQQKDLPYLFQGEIEYIQTKNKKTTIYCGEYMAAHRDIKISKSWPENTTYYQVLQDLFAYLRRFGIAIGNQTTAAGSLAGLVDKTLPGGMFIAGGNIFDNIAEITRSIGYVSYFAGGQFHVEPEGVPPIREVFEIDIDAIKEFVNKQQVYDPDGKFSAEGVTLRVFLDGRIKAGSIIKIPEGIYKGAYQVKAVTHYLDYEGTWWETELEADILFN